MARESVFLDAVEQLFTKNIMLLPNVDPIEVMAIHYAEINLLKNKLQEQLAAFPEESFAKGELFHVFEDLLNSLFRDPKLNTHIVDEWAAHTLNQLHKQKEGPDDPAYFLTYAIINDYNHLINALIKNDIGTRGYFFKNGAYHTAGFYMLEKNRFDLLEQIEPYISIMDLFETHERIYELESAKPELYKRLVAKVKKINLEAHLDWDTFFPIPLYLLTQEQQNYVEATLRKKIDSLALFVDNPQVKEALIRFLDDSRPLPFKKLSRLDIGLQCVQFLINPHLINQYHTSLCGPATLMQNIVYQKPELFVLQTLELAELASKKEKHYLPVSISTYPQGFRQTFNTLEDLWLHTVKHNYNSFIGYNPRSSLEMAMGLTTPYVLGNMFNDFGFDVVEENCQLSFAKTNRAGLFFEFARQKLADYTGMPAPFKLYGAKHVALRDNHERFEALCNWFKENPTKICPILVSAGFTKNLLDVDIGDTWFGVITPTHYINIKDFTYEETEDEVSFTACTWGQQFAVLTTKKQFEEHFLGGIFVEARNEHTLQAEGPQL